MNSLDASIFSKARVYLDREFELILRGIYTCYTKMLTESIELENNENKIRNRLYKDYLKNAAIKDAIGLGSYIFHPEVPEIDEQYAESARTDIMVYNGVNYMRDENAYYIIECKRIDGSKTLNNKYVSNGISRFIEDRYPTNMSVNAMIGFVVRKIEIKENTSKINGLTNYLFIKDFEHSYTSVHVSKKQIPFTLYHLMFDFSSKILKKRKQT